MAGEGLTNTTKDIATVTNSDEIDKIDINNREPIDKDTKNILAMQLEYVPKEVEGTKTDLTRALNLYKDKELFRCRGRFKHTDLTYDQKDTASKKL